MMRTATLAGLLFGLTGTGSAAVAVTIPVVATAFEVSLAQASWVLTVYAVTMGVAAAAYGRAADLYGIRLTLSVGVCLMALGALLGAGSTSYEMLIVARAVQGLGASAVPVLALALLSASPRAEERGPALARMTGTAIAVGAPGPLIGGLLEEATSWRVVMCLPALGPLVVMALWAAMPTERTHGRLDLIGGVCVVASSAGVMMTLQSPASGVALGAVGVLLLLLGLPALVLRTRQRPTGFLPVAVLKTPGLVRVMVAASAVPSAWFGLLIMLPHELSERGWAPIGIGLLMLPSALPGVLGPRVASRCIAGVGPVRTVWLAVAVAVVSLMIAAAGAVGPTLVLVAAMVVVNFAFGIGQPALAASVASMVPAKQRSGALGVASLIFFVGAGIGSTFAGLAGVVGSAPSICLLALLPLATVVHLLTTRRRRLLATNNEGTT